MNKNEGTYIQNGSDLHIMIKDDKILITLNDNEVFNIDRNNNAVDFVKVAFIVYANFPYFFLGGH